MSQQSTDGVVHALLTGGPHSGMVIGVRADVRAFAVLDGGYVAEEDPELNRWPTTRVFRWRGLTDAYVD